MEIETKRLILRTIKRDMSEISNVAYELRNPLINDKAVSEYLSSIACENAEEVFAFTWMNQANQLFFVIEDIDSHEFIGLIKGMQSDIEKNGIEICYFCNEAYRGNGYIVEALTAYIEYIKSNFKRFDNMYFFIRADNKPSISIMRKLGQHPKDRVKTPDGYYFFEYSINLKEEG